MVVSDAARVSNSRSHIVLKKAQTGHMAVVTASSLLGLSDIL